MTRTALVLAGSRGEDEPVARYAGVAHKALVPVGGTPMLLRVLDALKGAGFDRIAVSTGAAEVADLARGAGAETIEAAPKLSHSVARALEKFGAPILVTTADHALLASAWVAQFIAETPPDADVSVLLAERTLIEQAAPGTKRTYLRFADGAWSGCNLFLLRTPAAARALDLWVRVEAHRKQPWRIAALIGMGTLLRYAAGRLTAAEAVRRVGNSVGIRAAVVPSRFGLSAVDVDKPADLDLVRRLVQP